MARNYRKIAEKVGVGCDYTCYDAAGMVYITCRIEPPRGIEQLNQTSNEYTMSEEKKEEKVIKGLKRNIEMDTRNMRKASELMETISKDKKKDDKQDAESEK